MSCDTNCDAGNMVAGAIVDRSALTYTRGYVFPWRSKVRYGVLRTGYLTLPYLTLPYLICTHQA